MKVNARNYASMILLFGSACAIAASEFSLPLGEEPGVTVVYKDSDGEWPGGATGSGLDEPKAEALRAPDAGETGVWI